VFVIGGITLREVAVLRQLSAKHCREIIIGGTSIVSTSDVFDEIYATDPEEDKGGHGGGLDVV
jgi:hypothetical protein